MQFQCFFSSKAFPSYVRSLLPLFLNGTCRTPGERLTKALWTCLSQHLAFFFCSASVFFQKIPVVPKNKKLYGTCWQGFSESRVFLQKKNGEIWLNWHFCIIIHHEKWKKTAASSPGLHHGPSWRLKANLPTHVWRRHPIGCLSFFGRHRREIIILPQFGSNLCKAPKQPSKCSMDSMYCGTWQARQGVKSQPEKTFPSYAGHI